MKNRTLVVWGANSYGQLGVGRISEYELPIEIFDIPFNIVQISAGSRHCILLNNSGSLYISGRNDLCGGNECKFTKLELNQKFDRITTGWDVTAGFSKNQLYIWGNNSSNQLGFGKKEIINEPKEVILPNNEIAMDIKFGLKHTVFLTKSCKIFIVGALKYFKSSNHVILTVYNSIEWLQLMPNSIIGDITDFSCGQNHISFVIDKRMIYSIGSNKFNICTQISSSENITQLYSGWTHNMYLTESKNLFSYGRNNYGQLGNGTRENQDAPQKCSIFPIDKYRIGAEHGILKSGQNIYTWGWNEHRNCGLDSNEDILTPKLISLPNVNNVERNIVTIEAGAGFCMVLYESI